MTEGQVVEVSRTNGAQKLYDYGDDIRRSMHFILLYTTVGDAVSSNDIAISRD